MTDPGYERAFLVLLAAAVLVGGLSVAGVLSKTALLVITVVFAVAIMVFLSVLGGTRAKGAVLVIMLMGVSASRRRWRQSGQPKGSTRPLRR